MELNPEFAGMVVEARKRILPYVLETPLMHSFYLSDKSQNTNVYIKLENEQVTGAFKVRGAYNKTCRLVSQQRTKVYTASSGNHGIACLHAAQTLGCQLTIYCRTGVDQNKLCMLKDKGANVVLHGNDCIDAENKAREDAKAHGVDFISPYNDMDVMAGQGTIGYEILEQLPDVDCVLIPVGGGGLIAGMSAYMKTVKPSVEIVGCQPKNSKVMFESVKAGRILFEESLETLSDGTSGGLEDNTITFPYCQRYVDDWLLVEEDDIAKAIIFMLEKHHKVIEGAAGVTVGAFIANRARFAGKKVAIVSCGSNIGLSTLKSLLDKYN